MDTDSLSVNHGSARGPAWLVLNGPCTLTRKAPGVWSLQAAMEAAAELSAAQAQARSEASKAAAAVADAGTAKGQAEALKKQVGWAYIPHCQVGTSFFREPIS